MSDECAHACIYPVMDWHFAVSKLKKQHINLFQNVFENTNMSIVQYTACGQMFMDICSWACPYFIPFQHSLLREGYPHNFQMLEHWNS